MSTANEPLGRTTSDSTAAAKPPVDLHRSESLALVQLLVLYHLVWARATSLPGHGPDRSPALPRTGADSALHH